MQRLIFYSEHARELQGFFYSEMSDAIERARKLFFPGRQRRVEKTKDTKSD